MIEDEIDKLEKKIDDLIAEVSVYVDLETTEYLTRKEIAKIVRLSERTIADHKEFKKIQQRLNPSGKVLYPKSQALKILRGENYE